MVRLIITFILLTCCLHVHSNESIFNPNNDSIISKIIKSEQIIITDSLIPGDTLYRVIGHRCYDLEGNRFKQSGTIVQILVSPPKGNNRRTVISSYNINDYNDYEFIYQRELNRVSGWIDMLDVPKLIKDKEPCINNELEFAEVLGLVFMYDIVPKTTEKATVENDSINDK